MSKESTSLIPEDTKQKLREELRATYEYGLEKPDTPCECMTETWVDRYVYYNKFTRNLAGITALYGLMFVAIHALINPLLVVPVIALTTWMFTYSDMAGRKENADTDGANEDE